MTDDNGADRAETTHFQSEDDALDDELGDTLAIDGNVDGHESAATEPPAGGLSVPSPDGGYGRHRQPDPPDVTRRDPAGRDTTESPQHAPPEQPPAPVDPPEPAAGGPAAAAGPEAAVGPEAAAPPEGTPPEAADSGGKNGKKRKRRKAPWWELPLLVAFAIVIAVLVKTFVIQPFYIPSQSMERTLHGCPGCKGDRILVNKPIYDLRDPHPGDIVVFHAPPGWDDEPPVVPPSNPVLKVVRGFGQLIGFVPPDGLVLVKRVIATGGQTVKGDSAGHVLISKNGPAGPWSTLNEPYVFKDGDDSHATFGPVTVPKGRLWVMGDHRNDSADSRFHCGSGGTQGPDGAACDATAATVPSSEVIGKAVVIAWPPSRWRTLGTPSTFKSTAGAMALPSAAGVVFVLPILVIRRRRRRR